MLSKLIILSFFFVVVIEFNIIKSEFINETCSYNKDCRNSIEFSSCFNGKCSCIITSEFIGYDNVTRCTVPPRYNCSRKNDSLDCVNHASCINGTCHCNDGYMEDDSEPGFFVLSPNVCSKNVAVEINGKCEGRKQCQKYDENSSCKEDHRCRCPSKSGMKKISGKWHCLAFAFVGDKCDELNICYTNHSLCINGICSCSEGFQKGGILECLSTEAPFNSEKYGYKAELIVGCCIGAVFLIIGTMLIVIHCRRKRQNF